MALVKPWVYVPSLATLEKMTTASLQALAARYPPEPGRLLAKQVLSVRAMCPW